MGSARLAVGCVVLAGALFGTAGTAQALGPAETTPLGVGAVRLLVGAAALMAIMAVQGQHPLASLRLWRTRAGAAAGVCVALYQVCFFGGVERAGVALGTLVTVGSVPLFTGLLSWRLLAHRPSRTWALATGLCLLGLTLLMADGLATGRPSGVLLALGAGLAIASFTVVAKLLLDAGTPSLDVLAGSFSLGGLLLTPLLLAQPLGWLASPTGIALAVYLGVATMAAANVLYARGLAGLAPGPVSTLLLADPLTATVLGVLVLGETLALPAVAGLGLVLAGLLLQGFASARAPEADSSTAAVPL